MKFQELALNRYAHPKMSAVEVAAESETEKGVQVSAQDIRNQKAAKERREFNGRTSTQQLLLELENDPDGIVKTRCQGGRNDGPLESMFWTYRWCLNMYKRNPEVLSIDNTYKTNKYNMALTQFTGVNNLHTTFCIAWGILSNEKERAYRWVLEELKQVSQEAGIQYPIVFISDFDKALKNAFYLIYGENVHQQLCLWHIMKNVAFHVKVDYNGSIRGTQLAETLGGDGARTQVEVRSEEEEEYRAMQMGARLLNEEDRDIAVAGVRTTGDIQTIDRNNPDSNCRWEHSADGVLLAWKSTVYAGTREEFDESWER